MNSRTYQMFGYSMKLTKMRDSWNKNIVRIQVFNRAGNELFANYRFSKPCFAITNKAQGVGMLVFYVSV